MRRAALGLLVAALGWSAGPVLAEAVDPDAWCGDDHYYWVKEPAGWKPLPEPERPGDIDLGVSFGFQPPAGAGGAADVSLVMRVKGSDSDAPDADPRDVLSSTFGLMIMVGGEFGELRELKLAHPSMPSAAVQVSGERGTSYVVAIGVPRGGGSHAVLALNVQGREATPAELDALKGMLSSFRYDPDHYCYPKGDEVEKRLIKRGHRSLESDRAEAQRAGQEWEAANGFSFHRAALGCGLRARMFVPVGCGMSELDGKPVFLVAYYGDKKGYGDRPAAEFFAANARQIAIPWCFETRGAKAPPKLVFSGGDLETFQAFDCKEMRLGSPYRGQLRSEPASPR